MNARRENQIAWMLLGGVGIVLLGGFITFLSLGLKSIAVMVLGPVLILGGILMAGWGVFFGHLTNRQAAGGGVQWLMNCYVVGRFAVNSNGDMVFSDFEEMDHPKDKFFVQLKTPDGRQDEFECSRELIGQIGEGMLGNVQVKGRWLGSFTAVPRA